MKSDVTPKKLDFLGSHQNEEDFKTCVNFVVGNGYHYYCLWIKYLGVHLLKNIIINRILIS